MNKPKPGHIRMPTSTKEVSRWDLVGGDVAIVEIQEFEDGAKSVAIRRWYHDYTENKLKPGRSGIAFHPDDIRSLVEAMGRVSVHLPLGRGLAALPNGGRAAAIREETAYQAPAAESAAVPVARPSGPAPLRPPPRPLYRPGSPPAAAPAIGPTASAHVVQLQPRPEPEPEQPGQQQLPHSPRQPAPGVTLAAIIAKGLVAAPLQVRVEHRGAHHKGVVCADGSLLFGNRRFGNPREAIVSLKGMMNVVDAWKFMQYRNPATRRFARLSRLRNQFLGLEEGEGEEGDA